MKYLQYLIAIILSTLAMYPALAKAEKSVAQVVWVKGVFKATAPDKTVRKLQKSSLIYLHDTLSTDPDAQAQIAFTDNSLMTFKGGTQFYVNKYDYQPKDETGSGGSYVMDLIKGGFRTITGLIAKRNPNEYQVNTPVATIGVRGTDYAVFLRNSEENAVVALRRGIINVKNDKGEIILTPDKPYAQVQKNQAPEPLAKLPPDIASITLRIQESTTPSNPDGTVKTETETRKTTQKSRTKKSNVTGVASNFCIK